MSHRTLHFKKNYYYYYFYYYYFFLNNTKMKNGFIVHLKTIKSYNLRMKIKQLVIFTILNSISIRKYLHHLKKTELNDQ